MPRRHAIRPDLARATWLIQQFTADRQPITDSDVVRFGHNPELCLTDLCLESQLIDGGIQDLCLSHRNQPAWIGWQKNHPVLSHPSYSIYINEASGASHEQANPDDRVIGANLFGMMAGANPVVLASTSDGKMLLYVAHHQVWSGNLEDFGVFIFPNKQEGFVFWGWQPGKDSAPGHAQLYLSLWGAGVWETSLLVAVGSRILDCFGPSADDLYVRFALKQGLGPKNASLPKGLYSLRLGRELAVEGSDEVVAFASEEGSPHLDFLAILGKRDNHRIFYHFDSSGKRLVVYGMEMKMPGPYCGGFRTLAGINLCAYRIGMRHEQVAWVVGRDEVQPAMNQVSDLFQHPVHGWCYWGSVGQHLCLMKLAIPG